MTENARASRPVVLVWRNQVLQGSETFIRNQVSSMRGWQPRLVGAGRIASALSRPEDVILFGQGRLETARRKAFRLFRRSRRLNDIVEGDRVALVHAHFGPDAVTVFPTARRSKVPLVLTFHGSDVTKATLFTGFEGWRYRRRVRQALSYASKVIAVSDFIADQVSRRFNVDPESVVVQHIGIPLGEPLPLARPAAEWDVVFVGRLTAKKGTEQLLRAVASLEAPFRDSRVAIIGAGVLADSLGALATELGLRVSFLGRCTPAEVSEVLLRSRVFVGPSRTAASGDSEGFGMVFLEAALAELPVVAYRHGGVPEAVVDGVTGLLAPENDIATLAAHIGYLLANPQIAAQMGAAGRARVIRDFDVEKQTILLEEIYDDVTRLHDR